jgi:hypothetical protein
MQLHYPSEFTAVFYMPRFFVQELAHDNQSFG